MSLQTFHTRYLYLGLSQNRCFGRCYVLTQYCLLLTSPPAHIPVLHWVFSRIFYVLLPLLLTRHVVDRGPFSITENKTASAGAKWRPFQQS